jgi:hypothetical protein
MKKETRGLLAISLIIAASSIAGAQNLTPALRCDSSVNSSKENVVSLVDGNKAGGGALWTRTQKGFSINPLRICAEMIQGLHALIAYRKKGHPKPLLECNDSSYFAEVYLQDAETKESLRVFDYRVGNSTVERLAVCNETLKAAADLGLK